MSKCEFNKLHFGMGVFLYIKFTACIFSEHIFLRPPLDGCFWYRLFGTLPSWIWKGVNLHVVETKWEAKNFHKNFHNVLERGGCVEIKHHITYFREQIELRLAPKKEVEKLWATPNTCCFSSWRSLLGARNRCPKNEKSIFFPIYIIFFKVSCTLLHCFYILRNLRSSKLGIITHFIFTNLPRYSQSMNSLIYVYCIQIPSWSESWSHFFVLPPPKNIFCITPWWVFIFGLGTSTNKRRVSTRSGKSGNLLENQEKSGKFDLFWKKSGKKIFIHANF